MNAGCYLSIDAMKYIKLFSAEWTNSISKFQIRIKHGVQWRWVCCNIGNSIATGEAWNGYTYSCGFFLLQITWHRFQLLSTQNPRWGTIIRINKQRIHEVVKFCVYSLFVIADSLLIQCWQRKLWNVIIIIITTASFLRSHVHDEWNVVDR